MKVILFCVSLLALLSSADPQTVGFNPAIWSEKGREAFSQLLDSTDTFGMCGVGLSGARSKGEIALLELLQEPDCENALVFLTLKARAAGPLYALIGLKFKNKQLFKEQLEKVKASLKEENLIFQMGCSPMPIPKSALVESLESETIDPCFWYLKREVRTPSNPR